MTFKTIVDDFTVEWFLEQMLSKGYFERTKTEFTAFQHMHHFHDFVI